MRPCYFARQGSMSSCPPTRPFPPRPPVDADVDAKEITSFRCLVASQLSRRHSNSSCSRATVQDDQLAHSVGESVGPQITSHPFGEMLAGREVGTPAIASLVPTDRYLVHIDNMGAALDWLDRSAASGLELTGLKLGTYVAHDLVDGYLSRLHFPGHLSRSWHAPASLKSSRCWSRPVFAARLRADCDSQCRGFACLEPCVCAFDRQHARSFSRRSANVWKRRGRACVLCSTWAVVNFLYQ